MSGRPAFPSLHLRPQPRLLDVPVVLFAFKRPDYLARVCASLLRQDGIMLDPRRVFLLQDGPVSPRSGLRYAEDAEIQASVAAFRTHFPRGEVLASPDNLGISVNIRRGETLAFETLDRDCAYFFEDDLELGPDYLRIMEELRALSDQDPRIGYFACYGDHAAMPPGPAAHLLMLQHHWAFGLKREPWRRLREWLAPYDRILEGADYAFRDDVAIFRWMESLPVAGGFSSQDAVKTLGCNALGIARVMTDVCFARYIGAEGASFSAAKFREMGYDRMEWVRGPEHHLAPEAASEVTAIIEEPRKRHEHYRQHRLAGLLEQQLRLRLERDRPATREDVVTLYRFLLDRTPEEAAVDDLAGRYSVRRVREILLESREYRGRNPRRPG
ncbi:glycosyltransferase family protein [Muricoccus vinaceus]|uniref:Glycosyl transferase family 2 n=1 Tax=Muricoccus vinaceus TaxID=424704 RepID=A0ABV6IXJ7_9PROT